MTVPFITRDSAHLSKLGTLTEDQETVVDELIKAVCVSVERYIRRTIKAADHDEVQPVGEDGVAFLDNFPVISVDRVFTDRVAAFRLANSTATTATVVTSDEKLRLISVTAGVKTTTVIEYADQPTLGDLATAVAAVSGWEALVATGYSGYASADLIRGQHRNAKATSDLWLWLDSEHEIEIDETKGLVVVSAPEVRVQYRAGWDCVPDDLQRVAAEMVLAGYDKSHGSIQSESLGDYSVSYALGALNELPLRSKAVLSSYKDRRP